MRRIVLWLLTCVLTGSPAASTVCQFVCTTSDSHAAAQAGGATEHACHDTDALPAAVRLTMPDACGQHDGMPTVHAIFADKSNLTTGVAILRIAISIPGPLPTGSDSPTLDAVPRGSVNHPLAVPLRI